MSNRAAASLAGEPVYPGGWEVLVGQVGGVQLVVGGPGTGKTELLARRAAHLINAGAASSDQVLALSFSRETAADLRRRITDATHRSFGELAVGTFHAFARTLVEEHSRTLFGSADPPLLLTAPEQIQFIKEVLADEDPARWPVLYQRMLDTHTMAEELADFMLRCGEQRITPEQLEVRSVGRQAWKALPGFYRSYLQRLEREDKIDYTGLLLRANRALGIPEILRRTTARFPYVLVDEYQEATLVQLEILQKLVSGGCHLTAVADPQQTSFSFRGAERASVNDFPEAFALAEVRPKIFRLNQSFRLSEQVLCSAAQLVPDQARPSLPAPAPHAGRVEFYVFDQEMAENDWIATEVRRLHLEEGVSYTDIAVLNRTTGPLGGLSRALDRMDIPHVRPGGRLIDHPAVRLVLDLAKASVMDRLPEPTRQETAELDQMMESVLLGPLFSLTEGRARELRIERRRRHWSWAQILSQELPAARSLASLLEDSSWADNPPATNGFWKLWSQVAQFSGLAESGRPGHHGSALSSFAQTLGRLAERSPRTSLLDYRNLTLEGDLEASALMPTETPGEGQVTIGTIHQAKGRQFEVVFIFSATEGLFPDTRPFRSLLEGQLLSQPDMDYLQLLNHRLREEQNLAYIAMTRARRRVVWTATTPDLDEAQSTVSRFAWQLAEHAGMELGTPQPRPTTSPTGPLEAQTYLRRIQKDIHQPLPRRLAAAAVLAQPVRSDLWNARTFAGVPEPGSDRGLIDPNHVMSPSQAQGFDKCPRQYALQSRLRIRPPDENPYARFGLLIHQVLHSCGQASLRSGAVGLDLKSALDELDRQMAQTDFGTPVLNQAWRDRGAKLLQQLAERWVDDGARPIAFEKEVDTDLAGIRWKGRIDRVDRMANGTLRVIDYKTSKNPPTFKEAAVSLQLGFYLWALSQVEPHTRAGGAEFWHPLSEGSWVRSLQLAKLPEVVKALAQIARDIVTEGGGGLPWPAKPSNHCKRCEVRTLCPEWDEGKDAFVS